MMDSRDFLFEFRETRDRVMLRRKILTALQLALLAAAGALIIWLGLR